MDAAARRRSEEALAFLTEAGRLLSASLDVDVVLDTLVGLALPRLGDHAIIDLLDESGGVGDCRTAHLLPEKAPLLRAYRERYPPGPRNLKTPVWKAIQTGEPIIARDLPDSYLDTVVHDEDQASLLLPLRARAFMVMPLKALGRTIGAMSFISETDWEYGEDDVKLARELAGRAAIALENAMLHQRVQNQLEAAERARGWTEQLQRVTMEFAGTLHPEEVAAVVMGTAKEALGAFGGGVFLLTPDERDLEMIYLDGWDEGHHRVAPWRRFPAEEGNPLVDAIRDRTLVTASSREECRRRYPEIATILRRGGYSAFAAMPMEVDGKVIGVINYQFRGEHVFSEEERNFIIVLGQLAAQVIHRAKLHEAEAEARRAAEEANRAKSDFLQVMSHELRTPLNSIAGYTANLTAGIYGALSVEQEKVLGRVKESERHLLGILDSILDFQSVASGTIDFRMELKAIGEIMVGLEALMRPMAAARGVAFSFKIDDPRSAVWVDAEKLRRLLLHLVGNAVRFTSASGEVRVHCETHPEAVCVHVHDTGIGIPAEKLDTVFEPFVQLDMGLTRRRGGTGLGLAIGRSFVEGMGGELTATSEPGTGSVFSVRLRRTRPERG